LLLGKIFDVVFLFVVEEEEEVENPRTTGVANTGVWNGRGDSRRSARRGASAL
jgi:hypothetical protein